MNQPINLYNLFCLNRPCINSVFHKAVKTEVVFNEANLTAIHICTNCHELLMCAMDILIEQTMAELIIDVNYGVLKKR